MKNIHGKMFCAACIGLGSLMFADNGLGAIVTWQVQSSFSSSSTRSARGIALSPDGSNEYLGFIQGTGGSTAVSEYSSAAGLGLNPAAINSATDNGLQPKGVASDDRGYVYSTYSNSTSPSTTQKFEIYNSSLGSPTSPSADIISLTLPASSQLGGIAVQNLGGTYYAYVASNKGSAVIERFNVTNPAAPTLDNSWGVNGVMNLQAILGNNNVGLDGLTVGPDGTVYATGTINAVDRGDEVFQINSSGTSVLNSAAVTGAFDDVLYNGSLYVAEYNGGSSLVDVLNASDLSFNSVIDPSLDVSIGMQAPGSDNGFAGITVNATGQLYVVDEDFNGSSSPDNDQVLISSAAVPEPATMVLLGLGCAPWLLGRRRRLTV